MRPFRRRGMMILITDHDTVYIMMQYISWCTIYIISFFKFFRQSTNSDFHAPPFLSLPYYCTISFPPLQIFKYYYPSIFLPSLHPIHTPSPPLPSPSHLSILCWYFLDNPWTVMSMFLRFQVYHITIPFLSLPHKYSNLIILPPSLHLPPLHLLSIVLK